MQSSAATVDDYIKELAPDRQAAVKKIRAVIKKHLPKGFNEEMGYGMIGYVVPHTIYPAGYHSTPKLPLPFMNLASQKNFIALHHLGLYADNKLLDWFVNEYEQAGVGKLDMGKGCVRFKKLDKIPYELIGELIAKVTVDNWIKIYEEKIKR